MEPIFSNGETRELAPLLSSWKGEQPVESSGVNPGAFFLSLSPSPAKKKKCDQVIFM